MRPGQSACFFSCPPSGRKSHRASGCGTMPSVWSRITHSEPRTLSSSLPRFSGLAASQPAASSSPLTIGCGKLPFEKVSTCSRTTAHLEARSVSGLRVDQPDEAEILDAGAVDRRLFEGRWSLPRRSGPTAGRAGRPAHCRTGGLPGRPCAARSTRDKIPVPCTRRRPGSRARSHHSEIGRSHVRVRRTRGTLGAPAR